MDLYPLGQYLLYVSAAGLALFCYRKPLASLVGRLWKTLRHARRDIVDEFHKGLND